MNVSIRTLIEEAVASCNLSIPDGFEHQFNLMVDQKCVERSAEVVTDRFEELLRRTTILEEIEAPKTARPDGDCGKEVKKSVPKKEEPTPKPKLNDTPNDESTISVDDVPSNVEKIENYEVQDLSLDSPYLRLNNDDVKLFEAFMEDEDAIDTYSTKDLVKRVMTEVGMANKETYQRYSGMLLKQAIGSPTIKGAKSARDKAIATVLVNKYLLLVGGIEENYPATLDIVMEKYLDKQVSNLTALAELLSVSK